MKTETTNFRHFIAKQGNYFNGHETNPIPPPQKKKRMGRKSLYLQEMWICLEYAVFMCYCHHTA
jgi:hypothetical protein